MKIKIGFLILIVTAFLTPWLPAQMDEGMAKNSLVVLRTRLISEGDADKYRWSTVEILKILKNESGETFGKTMEVASYSFKPGIPEGVSTLYLERYNPEKRGLWKLAGGQASTGISHHMK